MISRYEMGHPHLLAFSTTRHGGQSKGEYSSFNINEYCGDDPADIAANRRLLCDELGIDEAHLVMPHQTHGVVVRQIAEEFVHLPDNIQDDTRRRGCRDDRRERYMHRSIYCRLHTYYYI